MKKKDKIREKFQTEDYFLIQDDIPVRPYCSIDFLKSVKRPNLIKLYENRKPHVYFSVIIPIKGKGKCFRCLHEWFVYCNLVRLVETWPDGSSSSHLKYSKHFFRNIPWNILPTYKIGWKMKAGGRLEVVPQ